MRKIFKLFILSSVVLLSFTACEDLLDADSERYVDVDDNDLSNPNDSIYSILGLFSQMQKINERYVFFGEFRGDLLDVTPHTPAEIRQINNFAVDADNEYADPTDYYNIINNCNYIISRTNGEKHPLAKENVAARAIRAWTYMQIAYTWGKVYYYTDPILSIDDENKQYPVYSITDQKDEFASLLINDLEPYLDTPFPNYGTIYNFSSRYLFFPLRVLLGDLYLLRGQSEADYEKAAEYYATYLVREDSRSIPSPFITWSYENFSQQNFERPLPNDNWRIYTEAFNTNPELVSVIQMATSLSEGETSTINRGLYITYYQPSSNIYTLWDDQNYVYNYAPTAGTSTKYYTTGDLRRRGNIYSTFGSNPYDIDPDLPMLYKLYFANHIMVYRKGLILLRYAEALNRSGRPNAAFAVLKYGFNRDTFTSNVRLPQEERASFITIFYPNEATDDQNPYSFYGIHSRGCGDTDEDDTYSIGIEGEELLTKADTITRVENLIIDELALETSFEGNRFSDLLRFSLRRQNPEFLASKVAAKHTNSGEIYQLLLDMNNWFLPEPNR